MKKTLILFACLSIAITTYANEAPKNLKSNEITIKIEQKQQTQKFRRDMAFEKRLGLTEVQKLKARQIREKGHEQLKPVMDEIKLKKQEAEMVRRSRIAVQVQEERLNAIDAELKVLERKAQTIRKSNMKEFESILTWEQKRTLKKMKKEGRKMYREAHPATKVPHHKPF